MHSRPAASTRVAFGLILLLVRAVPVEASESRETIAPGDSTAMAAAYPPRLVFDEGIKPLASGAPNPRGMRAAALASSFCGDASPWRTTRGRLTDSELPESCSDTAVWRVSFRAVQLPAGPRARCAYSVEVYVDSAGTSIQGFETGLRVQTVPAPVLNFRGELARRFQNSIAPNFGSRTNLERLVAQMASVGLRPCEVRQVVGRPFSVSSSRFVGQGHGGVGIVWLLSSIGGHFEGPTDAIYNTRRHLLLDDSRGEWVSAFDTP